MAAVCDLACWPPAPSWRRRNLRLRVLLLHHFADGAAQARHPVGRHAGGREEGVPAAGRQVQAGFLEGRHVGREGRAPGAGRRQDAQLARLVLRQQGVEGVEGHRHLAADEVGQQRARAAVAHHLGRNLRLVSHHQAEEVRQAAGGRHTEVGLVGVGAQPGQQVLDFLDRHGGGDGDAELVVADLRHRLEILVRVVAVILEHQRRHHHGRRIGQHQHVLAGGQALGLLHRQAAAGAGLVLDHHRPAQPGGQLVGHDARRAVAGAAGGVGDDQAQRPLDRLGVQGQGGGSGEGRQGGANKDQAAFHRWLLKC
jgi:hypothetical protein